VLLKVIITSGPRTKRSRCVCAAWQMQARGWWRPPSPSLARLIRYGSLSYQWRRSSSCAALHAPSSDAYLPARTQSVSLPALHTRSRAGPCGDGNGGSLDRGPAPGGQGRLHPQDTAGRDHRRFLTRMMPATKAPLRPIIHQEVRAAICGQRPEVWRVETGRRRIVQRARNAVRRTSASRRRWSSFSQARKGFDHGVGHPLLLLCDAKAPKCLKDKAFKDLDYYSEWPKVADAVIKAQESTHECDGPSAYGRPWP
jgi:hypothetical protein